MKSCHLCGNDLSMWNLDDTRLLECDLCVQWTLMQDYPITQAPKLAPQPAVAGQTAVDGTTAITWDPSKKWDTAKNPIKWSDML